jgi:hypothetical protein
MSNAPYSTPPGAIRKKTRPRFRVHSPSRSHALPFVDVTFVTPSRQGVLFARYWDRGIWISGAGRAVTEGSCCSHRT